MKRKPIISQLLPSLLVWAWLCPGCTQEQATECPQTATLDIKVVDIEGEDITGNGEIETLSLYIFDHRQLYLKNIDARVGEPLSIYFPNQDTLHVVSWGNLSSGHQEVSPMVPGTPMSQAVVRLNKTQPPGGRTASPRTVAESPDDLFYSYDVISLKSDNQTSYKLQMNRTVGSMSIVLRNLQSYANRYDENFALLVRETYDAVDFYGRLTGNKVGYLPAASFNDKKELVAPLFNLLPSHAEGNIEIDVYHENTLVTTVKNDSRGHPLRVLRGRVLNVLVDFRIQVSVEASITPWGVTQVWKEY